MQLQRVKSRNERTNPEPLIKMTNWKLKAALFRWVTFSALTMLPIIALPAGTSGGPVIQVEAFFKQDKLVNMKISPNGEFIAATVALADRTDLIFLSRNAQGVKLISQTGVTAKQHVSYFEWVNPSRVIFRINEQNGKLSQPLPSPGHMPSMPMVRSIFALKRHTPSTPCLTRTAMCW